MLEEYHSVPFYIHLLPRPEVRDDDKVMRRDRVMAVLVLAVPVGKPHWHCYHNQRLLYHDDRIKEKEGKERPTNHEEDKMMVKTNDDIRGFYLGARHKR